MDIVIENFQNCVSKTIKTQRITSHSRKKLAEEILSNGLMNTESNNIICNKTNPTGK